MFKNRLGFFVQRNLRTLEEEIYFEILRFKK